MMSEVLAAVPARRDVRTRATENRLTGPLLVCGVLSAPAYMASDVLVSAASDHCSYLHQSYSELLAIGSRQRDR